jgi:uncharacterized membrane protein
MPTLDSFINYYYLEPLQAHEGYNVVNTVTYAIIAIAAVYLLYRYLKTKIAFDRSFVCGVLSFVLLGSTVRVITDAIGSGVFKPVTPLHALVLNSHVYDYSLLTASPGIYLVTAGLLFVSMAILYRMKHMEWLWIVGVVLWLPHFLLLLPFMQYAVYAVPVILLAAVPAAIAYLYFRDSVLTGIVAAHALDGAATFFVIDVFSKISGIQYFEQHVLASGIGTISGTYFTFYLVKIVVSFAAAYFVMKEDMDAGDKRYIALVLMIMGFAPGIRDMLRMMVGA